MNPLSLMVEGRLVREVLKSRSFLLVRYADGTSHTIDWLDEDGMPLDGYPLVQALHYRVGSLAAVERRQSFPQAKGPLTRLLQGRRLRDVVASGQRVILRAMHGDSPVIGWSSSGRPRIKYEGWHIFANAPIPLKTVYRPRESGLLVPE